VTQVNGEINLVWLGDINQIVLPLLHEDSNKLIADLGGMFGVVVQTELLAKLTFLPLRLFLNLDVFGLELFAPAELIKALTEEHCVGYNDLVEVIIDLLRDPMKI